MGGQIFFIHAVFGYPVEESVDDDNMNQQFTELNQYHLELHKPVH